MIEASQGAILKSRPRVGLLTHAWRIALDLVYPQACAVCGRSGSMLCGGCLASLPATEGLRCDRCWQPLPPWHECRNCAAHGFAFARLRAPFLFERDARELVHALKFRDLSALAPSMAVPMVEVVEWPVDVVVPVPLSPKRERQRGYNQARLLARGVAEALGVPMAPALVRLRDLGQQARAPNREQRWLNVRRAFGLKLPAEMAGRSVLLVDDVTTTGATLDACARAALAAGALEVSAVTFARED